MDLIGQRYKDQDLIGQRYKDQNFKIEVREDLDKHIKAFRQIKSCIEEAPISAGGEARGTPSERQLHTLQ